MFLRHYLRLRLNLLGLVYGIILGAGIATASEPHSGAHHQGQGMSHGMNKADHSPGPDEVGQGAFAALAEIVALLESDPQTDWSTVDIDGLREHLVDMNQLTLNARVSKQVGEQEVVFTVSGTGATLGAIQRMVPAHSAQLARATPWQTETKMIGSGVVFTLRSQQASELQKIAGLGFFGIMAVGNHHQRHHWQMAIGKGHFH